MLSSNIRRFSEVTLTPKTRKLMSWSSNPLQQRDLLYAQACESMLPAFAALRHMCERCACREAHTYHIDSQITGDRIAERGNWRG
eukprot:44912-Eustigmatos_ZCMA.PRE.1